jgi:hypothetical protein
MERRDFLTGLAVAPLAAAVQGLASLARLHRPRNSRPRRGTRAPIKQSVMASVWGQSKLSFDERCQVLQRLGLQGHGPADARSRRRCSRSTG